MSSFSRSHKTNDTLKTAANIHVKIGHMQRYCELMVEIGEVSNYLMNTLRTRYRMKVVCANVGSLTV
jgi:hypothetical protein